MSAAPQRGGEEENELGHLSAVKPGVQRRRVAGCQGDSCWSGMERDQKQKGSLILVLGFAIASSIVGLGAAGYSFVYGVFHRGK